MDANLTLVLTAAAMMGCGIFLLLERSLSRVLVGVLLIGNATSLMLLVSGGPAGEAPIVGETAPADMSDALPQALVLTAIVIMLATTAFVLAMAYRSWQLNGNDDVQDDMEDARIRRLAELDESSSGYDLSAADQSEKPLEEGS